MMKGFSCPSDRAVRTKRTMGQTTDWRLETQHLFLSPESEAARCAAWGVCVYLTLCLSLSLYF